MTVSKVLASANQQYLRMPEFVFSLVSSFGNRSLCARQFVHTTNQEPSSGMSAILYCMHTPGPCEAKILYVAMCHCGAS